MSRIRKKQFLTKFARRARLALNLERRGTMKLVVSKTITAGMGGPLAIEVSDETYEKFLRVADLLCTSASDVLDEIMAGKMLLVPESVIIGELDRRLPS